ncbi:mannan-binding lectin serine protease 2 isoform X2 [Megachile rotundata]|uniref:mannan-binding lectin serine protease 2 isoform X2 n=1 Tax=Megachile rotundata TaxID=143995 RepID=UPI003FD36E6A
MAPGATTLSVLLLLTITGCTTVNVFDKSYSETLKVVRLPGGYMELLQKEHCSHQLLRLSCRSLKAFIFVLEAEYLSNFTQICGYESKRKNTTPGSSSYRKRLKGNYIYEDEQQVVDIRKSLNRRCSGQVHCRYNFPTDHAGTVQWYPATLRIKYACIPETAVRRFCNEEVKVVPGEGGFIKSPGYPLYYPGENTCGWTFRSAPDHRILLTFHDLDIRGAESDGSCVDVVRVREKGRTLFEHCGTAAGVKIISNSNVITLDLIVSNSNVITARGFFLQYQVLGCPDISTPNGSYVLNGTLTSRTFLCKLGSVFPDSNERIRTLQCKNGKWNESVVSIPSCKATSAVILKTEHEHNQLSSLSGDNVVGSGVRIGRGENADAVGNGNIMDSAQSAMMKQTDYVVGKFHLWNKARRWHCGTQQKCPRCDSPYQQLQVHSARQKRQREGLRCIFLRE